MTITLKKDLPEFPAWYYWTNDRITEIEIVEVESRRDGSLVVDRVENGIKTVEDLGGYWALFDPENFRIER